MFVCSEVLVLLTLRIQQSSHAQFSFCDAEGLLQVLLVGLTVDLIHVDHRGPAVRTEPLPPGL